MLPVFNRLQSVIYLIEKPDRPIKFDIFRIIIEYIYIYIYIYIYMRIQDEFRNIQLVRTIISELVLAVAFFKGIF